LPDRLALEAGGMLLLEDGVATDALSQEDQASMWLEDGYRLLVESVVSDAVLVQDGDDLLLEDGTWLLAESAATVVNAAGVVVLADAVSAATVGVGVSFTAAVVLGNLTAAAAGTAGTFATAAITLRDFRSGAVVGVGANAAGAAVLANAAAAAAGLVAAPVYAFTPPTTQGAADVINREYHRQGVERVARRLVRFNEELTRGVTVLKTGGVYVNHEAPTTDDLATATEVYLGGHTYTIDQTTAAALTSAGYTVAGYP
jgi:hypothetical protein